MSTYGIIAEYNPFHNGHLYQIKQIKEKDPDAKILVLCSTYFVQRGLPSYLEPNYKTKAALESGVDLILGLPSYFSLQSAENFALGGLSILNSLEIIDYLVFGTESPLEELKKVVSFQRDHKERISKTRKDFLNQGYNYNDSYIKSIHQVAKNSKINFSSSLFQSNNILGIEYLKSLYGLNSSIRPLSILRIGHSYNSMEISKDSFASASGIRKHFVDHPEKVENQLPLISFKGMENSKHPSLDSLYPLMKYKALIDMAPMTNITGFEEGFDIHIQKSLENSNNYRDFMNLAQTKRYRKNRIGRFMLNYLLNIKTSFIDHSLKTKPEWVRVLGFGTRGQELLRKIKDRTNVLPLTQHKQIKKLSLLSKAQYEVELSSFQLYYFNEPSKFFYKQRPIIQED